MDDDSRCKRIYRSDFVPSPPSAIPSIGRTSTRPADEPRTPATLWIFVVSKASSKVSDGRMVGMRLASIVVPDPGPLLDRIDIHIDVPAVNYRELRSTVVPKSSADIRSRILRAREIQLDRFARGAERIYANAQMGPREIRKYCNLGTESEHLLSRPSQSRGSAPAPRIEFLRCPRHSPNWRGGVDRALAYRSGHPVSHLGSNLLGVGRGRRFSGGTQPCVFSIGLGDSGASVLPRFRPFPPLN